MHLKPVKFLNLLFKQSNLFQFHTEDALIHKNRE